MKNARLIEDSKKLVLVSYATPVLVLDKTKGMFFVTNEKFSSTTSKHINGYLAQWGITKQKASNLKHVDQSEIVRLSGNVSIVQL